MMRFDHLKEAQLLHAVLGDARTRDLQHSRDCVACGGEVLLLEQALADFRDSVHCFAGHQQLAMPRSVWNAPVRDAIAPVRWAVAAVALIALLAAPVYRAHLQHNYQAQLQQDSALMQQIDDEISSPVPHAMEPLVAVVDWSSSDGPQTATKELGAQQ